ncbi:MAG: prenyltransferase/squalene oxidase repeat-containing protein [Dehalococcoidia bacterium]
MRQAIFRAAAAFVAGLFVFSIPAATSAEGPADAVLHAARYIATTQQPDGGFGGFGDGQTFDAIFALRSAGIDPAQVKSGGKSPVDFLNARAVEQTQAASAAKAALAARAVNLDPRSLNGVDLLAIVSDSYDSPTGRYAADDFSHGIAMLGLSCNGVDLPNGALNALRAAQLGDGGWGFDGFSDPDTTAIALQALIAAGVPASDPSVAAALAYFETTQAPDGGWGFTPTESNTSSTAYVVQALIAAGIDPRSPRFGAPMSPLDYLAAQQAPDGSFAGFDPAFATNQVVPALAGRSFCYAPVTPASGGIPSARPVAPLPPNTGSGSADPGSPADGEALALVALLLSVTAMGLAVKRR